MGFRDASFIAAAPAGPPQRQRNGLSEFPVSIIIAMLVLLGNKLQTRLRFTRAARTLESIATAVSAASFMDASSRGASVATIPEIRLRLYCRHLPLHRGDIDAGACA